MNGKKWIKIVVILSVLCIGFVNAINYIVDPFNIFHTKFLKYQFQANERFMKIEFLEKNNQKFNAYMLGSSRIGTTPPSVIEKYIPSSKFYNFTISGSNLYDYVTHLKYFIKRKYPINTLYLQLDINNMAVYGRAESDYLRKLHPYTLDRSLILFYLEYLNGFFPFNVKGKIEKNLNYSDRTDYFLDIGSWTKPDKEAKIKKDCKKFIKSVYGFHQNNIRSVKYTTSTKSIKALSEIKALCKTHKIKLYVFTTPHNKNMMDGFVTNDYLKYLREISNITDFYDFSGYNTITLNNCNYYEESHYRPLVGEIIASRIFNDKTVKVPKDFGILVTKENINQHLIDLKKQIINYDLDKTLHKQK